MNEAAPPKPHAADGASSAPAASPQGPGEEGRTPKARTSRRTRTSNDEPIPREARDGGSPRAKPDGGGGRANADGGSPRAKGGGEAPARRSRGPSAEPEVIKTKAKARKRKPRDNGQAADDAAPDRKRSPSAAREPRDYQDHDDDRDDAREEPSRLRGTGDDDGEPEPAVYEVRFPEEAMDQDAVKVLLRLSQHGYQAYLVGGGVRDLLLGRTPKDFDVATSARPQDVRRIFRNCRVIGRRFRLAHVLFHGGKIIEVATFRRDHGQRIDRVPADLAKRWPLVSDYEPMRLVPSASAEGIRPDEDLLIVNDNVFGEPFEDAIRRDFTINGLFYDIEHEEVIDYVGGMADVERHVLRMIGDPIVRFREDPVRILRAIKFSARLDLGIAEDVLDAIQAYRGELARAAKPRILEEIFRLLRGGAAHRSFYLAWDLGVLAEILPELAGYLDDRAPDADLTWLRLAAVDAQIAAGEAISEAVMVSALLLGPLNEALDGARNQAAAFEWFMEEVSERIAMPRRLKDRIRLIIGSQGRLRSGKLGSIQTRDFFAEAAQLYALDCAARNQPVPDWAIDPPYVAPEEEPTRRRRRRRRN